MDEPLWAEGARWVTAALKDKAHGPSWAPVGSSGNHFVEWG
jgi:hypothetical protein